MSEKSRNIIQCPFCDSNRLYFRRGLVADVLISLLTPVRSYTCGSCSRSFRKYGNYFASKQALIHVFGMLALLAFINPSLLLPDSWLLQEETSVAKRTAVNATNSTDAPRSAAQETAFSDLPLLTMTIANATNSSFVVENGTVTLVSSNSSLNLNSTTGPDSTTLLAFNGSSVTNSTENNSVPLENATSTVREQGLQKGKLRSIYFKAVDGMTRIELDLGGPPLSYTSFFLRDPERLVVDIHGTWEYFGPTTLRPETPIFSRFRIGIYDDKLRMVMDLKGQTPSPIISKTANGLNIDVK